MHHMVGASACEPAVRDDGLLFLGEPYPMTSCTTRGVALGDSDIDFGNFSGGGLAIPIKLERKQALGLVCYNSTDPDEVGYTRPVPVADMKHSEARPSEVPVGALGNAIVPLSSQQAQSALGVVREFLEGDETSSITKDKPHKLSIKAEVF